MKQTVTSKYEPKSKDVTWIDMSTGSPVQKNFINGMWKPTGGGGGSAGSSNPTETDVNKVWQVTPVQKGTKTEEFVIVPEQTLVDEQELEYNDKFVPGAQCVAIVNDVEYRGEVIGDELVYTFFEEGICTFEYDTEIETFRFWNETELNEITAKLSVIEETTTYDYNWAPGVKIPVPTAEDEGKVLVVTKTEGNASIIVPEQQVPADELDEPILTNVDLTKFIVGNTVKVTILANSQTITATGVIVDDRGTIAYFDFDDDELSVWQTDNSLYTNATDIFGPDSTIKLEYVESNYEYQLQENGSGSDSTSNVIWPAMHEYNDNEIMATFVPEDVEPNTWCMVCGAINGDSIDTCLPVLIEQFDSYVLFNAPRAGYSISVYGIENGQLLELDFYNH